MGQDRLDFFVSYAAADRAWAEWIAWQLTDVGYSVELDVWAWAAGRNFVTAMSDALERADRVVALFSGAYFDQSRYTAHEWSAAILHLPGATAGKLVPVRVEDVSHLDIPAVLRPLVYRDVFGVSEEHARQVLLEAVIGPHKPMIKPMFPGADAKLRNRQHAVGPLRPGTMPPIWKAPARNPGFAGRDNLLLRIRETLLGGDRAVVQALHGMGGVGKTQLAVEYAHRFAGAYDLIWWVDAEEARLIGVQLAELAVEVGCISPSAELAVAQCAILGELRQRNQWLLVYDNANRPQDIVGVLPGGSGHVLITSRAQGWEEIAVPVEVDVLARAESVAILRGRISNLPETDADQVAEAVGDLPLAVAQAAGYMAETGILAEEYTHLLTGRAAEIMDLGRPSSYSQSLVAVTQLAFDCLRNEDRAAAQVAGICAFLAPEPVPAEWFIEAASQFVGPLRRQAADPVGWRQLISRVRRSALARIDHRGLQMHRLTQAIIRCQFRTQNAAIVKAAAERMLAANHPGDAAVQSNWVKWAQFLPHLLALNPATTKDRNIRGLAIIAVEYLILRGDFRASQDLANCLHRNWCNQLGPDDHDSLAAATWLARTWAVQDRFDKARELDEDTLARRRRILGEDHPDTLTSANNLAADLSRLGHFRVARRLAEDTLARRRRVLGEDHRNTLTSAANLGICLWGTGDQRAARKIDEDTLAHRRNVLGKDDPDTLWSAHNLATRLSLLGVNQTALELYQDTVTRMRRVLGADHRDTLRAADSLGASLRALGDYRAAKDLDEDTLARRRRVLGDEHLDTLCSVKNLAVDIRMLMRESGLSIGEVRFAPFTGHSSDFPAPAPPLRGAIPRS